MEAYSFFFVPVVLKLQKDVPFYGSIFVHSACALSRLSNVEIHVLQFWEIFSSYFSNFLLSGFTIFLPLCRSPIIWILELQGWSSSFLVSIFYLSLHFVFWEISTLSSNSSFEFLNSVDSMFLFQVILWSLNVLSKQYTVISWYLYYFSLSWDIIC